MSRPCHILRVFTRGDAGGNALGVVNDVVGLSSDDMQRIAHELGFSETVFVDWCEPTADPAVRIFTPKEELPFAGHPLVGTAWVLNTLGPGANGAIVTKVGRTTYRIVEGTVWVQVSIPIRDEGSSQAADVAVLAGMPAPVATRTLSLPKHYHLCEYASFDDVATLEPSMEELRSHFGLLAFARAGDDVKARFFAPSTGIDEDPATGSACVALAREFAIRGEHEGAVSVFQGDEIGHPSTIRLEWSPEQTRIGGTVVRDEVVLVR